MADVAVTATSVAQVTAQPNPSSLIQGVAGATLTRGKTVYLDTDNTWKLAINNSTIVLAGSLDLGISMSDVAIGQPCLILQGGDYTVGGTLVAGESYFVSSTAGGICPSADIIASKVVSFLGVALSTTVLRIPQAGPLASGITHG